MYRRAGHSWYFPKLSPSIFLTSNNPSSQDVEAVLQLVENCIPDNINEMLMVPFSSAEVQKAVFDYIPPKSLGLMVSRIYFIKNHGHFWERILTLMFSLFLMVMAI